MNRQSILKGTFVLSMAGLVAKVISAFYRVPLEHLTGTVGITYYQSVYGFYSFLTAASLVGIPNSISKLVSEALVNGNYKKAHNTFRIALLITGGIGIILSIFFIGLSRPLIEAMQWNEDTYYVMIGMGISPFFISVAGAIRGYLQGMQEMGPTAISQIIENVTKVFVGIGLVIVFLALGSSIAQAVGGAALGTSIGFILSSLFLFYCYRRRRKTIYEKLNSVKENIDATSIKRIAKDILNMAIPITIASSALSIMLFIDSVTLSQVLSDVVIVEGQEITHGMYVNGILGKVQTIINVPLVLSISLIISIVPSVSAAKTQAERLHDGAKDVKRKIRESIELASKLAIPAAIGIFVLARQILNMVYQEPEGKTYLELMAISMLFMILAQSLTGILQGLSKQYVALWIVLSGALIKLILNIVLMKTYLQGYGAAVATIIYYIYITIMTYHQIQKNISFEHRLWHTYGKPILSALIMGGVASVTYPIVHWILPSNAVSIIGSVLVGVLVYMACMLTLQGFSKEELQILPKSEWILTHFAKKEGQ